MTQHTWMAFPDVYRQKTGLAAHYKQACWTCGKFYPGVMDQCEYYLNQSGWIWGPGQPGDPFASMRTNTAASGGPGKTVLGSAGVGSNGMPVRPDAPPLPVWQAKTVEPAETRPGLTAEEIDRKAYDDFMRNL
jgi:hypothetical protein